MIQKYSHQNHFHLIHSWLETRKMPVPNVLSIPDCGFVSNSIAIAFLIPNPTEIAQIDNLVVNPKASNEERSEAFKELFKALEKEAKERGFKGVSILSKTANTSQRLLDSNFQSAGQFELLFKEI